MAQPPVRRYAVHPPQLVGRLGVSKYTEKPEESIRRITGEWDAAMQELQRFLKYLLDATDSSQTGRGIIGVVEGTVDHGETAGLADDDHEQYLKEKLAGGLASEIPTHNHESAAEAGLVNHQVLDALQGGTAGQYYHLTAAEHGVMADPTICRGGTILTPAGAVDVIVWRAPFGCTVTAVKGYRVGGTGATVNARRNGSADHLASDLSLTGADTWMDGGVVQNTAYVAGDKLEIRLKSVAGSPSQVAVQIDLVRT